MKPAAVKGDREKVDVKPPAGLQDRQDVKPAAAKADREKTDHDAAKQAPAKADRQAMTGPAVKPPQEEAKPPAAKWTAAKTDRAEKKPPVAAVPPATRSSLRAPCRRHRAASCAATRGTNASGGQSRTRGEDAAGRQSDTGARATRRPSSRSARANGVMRGRRAPWAERRAAPTRTCVKTSCAAMTRR